MGTRWGTSVYMSASSISTIAKTVIKSINEGDTLTAVSLPASTFHENTVKLASVLLGKKLGGIYVTTSRPSSHITAELEAAKADLSDLYFVDLVSMTVGGNTSDPRTLFIESPTMLESILLNITLLERRLKAKRRFVMFDSVNGLSIYSEPKVLREFINVLGNSMRIKEIYSMLMTVTEQTDEDLNSALDLLSDKIIR
jgi:KaiC/GvpD/RAD55 family RecA-like ATPase